MAKWQTTKAPSAGRLMIDVGMKFFILSKSIYGSHSSADFMHGEIFGYLRRILPHDPCVRNSEREVFL